MMDETQAAPPVEVPDDLFTAAYEDAMQVVGRYARRNPTLGDEIHDAAVSALLWAREHCNDAMTFKAFAGRAVATWISRTLWKLKQKAARRPVTGQLTHDVARRGVAKPVRPLLIEDLPEDLAFVVRLYFVDSYSLREIGLLTGTSANTADVMLKRAAALLAPGRVAPARRKGEKCLTAG